MLVLKVIASSQNIKLSATEFGAGFKFLMVNIRKTGCIYIHSYFCDILLSSYAMTRRNTIPLVTWTYYYVLCHCSK